MSPRQFITDRESDQEVNQLAQFAVSEEEASYQAQCFYHKSGIQMRKWRPRDVPADKECTYNFNGRQKWRSRQKNFLLVVTCQVRVLS